MMFFYCDEEVFFLFHFITCYTIAALRRDKTQVLFDIHNFYTATVLIIVVSDRRLDFNGYDWLNLSSSVV